MHAKFTKEICDVIARLEAALRPSLLLIIFSFSGIVVCWFLVCFFLLLGFGLWAKCAITFEKLFVQHLQCCWTVKNIVLTLHALFLLCLRFVQVSTIWRSYRAHFQSRAAKKNLSTQPTLAETRLKFQDSAKSTVQTLLQRLSARFLHHGLGSIWLKLVIISDLVYLAQKAWFFWDTIFLPSARGFGWPRVS